MSRIMTQSLDGPEAVRHFGKYRGLVTDNQDPSGRGRLRARVPEVLGDHPSGWAYPCMPYAGDGVGLFTIPEPGSGVWIEFEAGDPSRPIWSGCWWGDGQVPQAAPTTLRILKTQSGHSLAFDDDGKSVTVTDANGQKVRLDTDGIQIEDSHGQKVTMSAASVEISKGDKTVTLQASSIAIRAGTQSVEVGPASTCINGGALEVF
ncbi:MAG: phage baseplate assembly protein V [bacterium]